MNYSGRPFTTPLRENKGLCWSLFISAGASVLLTADIVPGFSSLLEMVAIPRILCVKILSLGILDFLLTFAVESGLKRAFPASLPPEKGFLSHHTTKTLKEKAA